MCVSVCMCVALKLTKCILWSTVATFTVTAFSVCRLIFFTSCNIISLWEHCCTASSLCFLFARWSGNGNKMCLTPPKKKKKIGWWNKAALYAHRTKLARYWSDFDCVLWHFEIPIDPHPSPQPPALFWLRSQAVTRWLSLDSSVKMNN